MTIISGVSLVSNDDISFVRFTPRLALRAINLNLVRIIVDRSFFFNLFSLFRATIRVNSSFLVVFVDGEMPKWFG